MWAVGGAWGGRAGLTRQVEGERDEAVIASQELQRLLPLHQRPEVIGHRLPVEEVVDTNQEVPGGNTRRRRSQESASLLWLQADRAGAAAAAR